MPPDLITVLAEPTRRRLVSLLGSGERSVTDLAAEFTVTRSAISQHLAVLVDAGLVSARQAGKYRYYSLVPADLAALREEMDHFWTAEVDALARVGPRNPEVEPVSFDRSVFVPVTPEEAFALVTEPERLRRWKTVAARIDLRAGGDFRFTVVPGHVAAGTVVEVDPGRRIVLAWGWDGDESLPPGGSTVTITLAPGDGGTFVRLVHEGLPDDRVASHAEGWNHYLDRLVTLTTDGDAGPDDWGMAPDPLDELTAMAATLAVCQRAARPLTEADAGRSTPCARFDVAQLVDHLLGSLVSLGQAAGGDIAAASEGTFEERIAAAGSAALEAWSARGTAGEIGMGGGSMPAAAAAGIISVELLVHAWDLATATGRTVAVSDEVCDYVLTLAARVIRPEARDGDQFGAAVAPDPDADSLARLVAFTGRQP